MVRLLTPADFHSMPWKNGAGRTTEIAVHPPGAALDTFAWRVSIADVERDGPFSRFPGIDRTIVLLEGAGMRLRSGRSDTRVRRALRQRISAVTTRSNASWSRVLAATSTRCSGAVTREEASRSCAMAAWNSPRRSIALRSPPSGRTNAAFPGILRCGWRRVMRCSSTRDPPGTRRPDRDPAAGDRRGGARRQRRSCRMRLFAADALTPARLVARRRDRHRRRRHDRAGRANAAGATARSAWPARCCRACRTCIRMPSSGPSRAARDARAPTATASGRGGRRCTRSSIGSTRTRSRRSPRKPMSRC